jgi:hypothetical protein
MGPERGFEDLNVKALGDMLNRVDLWEIIENDDIIDRTGIGFETIIKR